MIISDDNNVQSLVIYRPLVNDVLIINQHVNEETAGACVCVCVCVCACACVGRCSSSKMSLRTVCLRSCVSTVTTF